MRIAVCDDEAELRRDIQDKIKRMYPDAEVFSYADGTELLKAALPGTAVLETVSEKENSGRKTLRGTDLHGAGKKFDILFLDIRMQPLDGMETARRLRKNGSRAMLIFVTALKEQVFEAFDVGAFHYLVKPFSEAKFFEVLERAVKEYRWRVQEGKRWFWEEKWQEGNGKPEDLNPGAGCREKQPFLTVKCGAVTERVSLSGILYLEVFNRKILLHQAQDVMEFYGHLSRLKPLLGTDFVQPHRAYIVNLHYVLKYSVAQITLVNGETVPMAKKNYPEFVKACLRHAKRMQEARMP